MADLWVYRVDVFTRNQTPPDLTGFEVVTTDDHKIGRVDEATNEAGNSWIVVDTGFWIFGKKRMIPLERLNQWISMTGVCVLTLSKDKLITHQTTTRRASSRTLTARKWMTTLANGERTAAR